MSQRKKKPSRILGLTASESPGFTLTSVPFYPVPLTPQEVMALGDREQKIGQALKRAIKASSLRK